MTSPSPLKPSRLQRALELADLLPGKLGDPATPGWGGIESDQLVHALQKSPCSLEIALANVLLRLVDLDEQAAAHPVPGSPSGHGERHAAVDEFESRVEAWHAGNSTLPLHEFLGLTWEQYAQMLSGKPCLDSSPMPTPASPPGEEPGITAAELLLGEARAWEAQEADARATRKQFEELRWERNALSSRVEMLVTDLGRIAGRPGPIVTAEGQEADAALRKICERSAAADAERDALKARVEAMEKALDAAWEATGVRTTVRGLTTLDDVIRVHREQLEDARIQNDAHIRVTRELGEMVEKADARATEALARLSAEFDRGRSVGRADVGKYANALGRIDCELGYSGGRPLDDTVFAVEQLVAKLTASEARCNQLTGELEAAKVWRDIDVRAATDEADKAERVVAGLRTDLAWEHGWDLHRKEAMGRVVEAARFVLRVSAYWGPNCTGSHALSRLRATLSSLDAAPEAVEPVVTIPNWCECEEFGQSVAVPCARNCPTVAARVARESRPVTSTPELPDSSERKP